MIEKMTRYSFIVYSGDREEFLNTIQEQGVIDIKRSEKAVDEKSVQMFQRIAAAKEDMETIRKGVDAHLIALRTEEKALEDRLEQTIPWGNFEKDKIEALAGHGINLHFFCVPAKSFKKEWPEEYPLEVVSDTGSHVYFVTAGECDIPAKEIPMPSANADELQVMLDAKRNEIDRYAASLEARKSELPRLESLVKDTISELNVYLAGVTGEDAAEGSICVFEGYAPEADRERLCAVFDGMDIYYEAHDATLEDNPPIKLRNSRFAGLFESITRMYGMPVYDEFDPTPLLAIFFLLFFAMCMGDAGYGILLVLIGWGISKGKLKIAMFEGLGPIIMVLGVATFVVGLVLGTFFGIDLYQATWVPDAMKSFMVRGKVAGYDAQMVMALGVGVLHICLAMIFKAVYAVRRNGFANSLSTCGWTLLIVGGVLVAAAALLKFIPSESIKWVVIAIGAISALGIFIFNKPGRNPLLNVGAGLWDTYQMATGLLGDVLSYIRLYALGLAGGLLGAAFNTLALMVRGDSPTWQWLPFVLVLLIGHTLNLLMSCLGAFVHPLRLNFVEFFKNSGYEGKGLRYNPLKK